MDDLIEALQIMRKYANPKFPFHCEHDCLYVDINSEGFSQEDLDRLDEIGFFVDEDDGCFRSFTFGSC